MLWLVAKVWRYRQADWARLRDMLDDTCWDHLKGLSTTATKWVTETVLRAAETCIPLTTLRAHKSSHPWLNDRAVAVMDAKRGCTGNTVGDGDNARMWRRARCGVS